MQRLFVLIACAGCSFSINPGASVTDGGGGDGGADGLVDAAPDPWLTGYARRKQITLRASQIEAPGDGALEGFPVLISLDDAEVAATAQPSGADLAFTAADATTPLVHEVERFANNRLVAWVKVPSLPATTDTTLYLYYSHPSPPPATPTEVWTQSFHAVYHLSQDPGPGGDGDIRDASPTALHARAEGSMGPSDLVEGKVGPAIDFDGSNDCIEVPSLDVGPAFSISMWANMNAVSQIRSLLASSPDGSNTNGYRFFANTNGSSDRRIHFEVGNGSSSDSAISLPAIVPDSWQHVAVLVDRAGGTATILVDGQVVNGGDTSIRSDFSTSSDLEIGRMETNNPFSGQLDQVEIASTVRSIEWIRTAFANQSAPGSFHEVGPEETR